MNDNPRSPKLSRDGRKLASRDAFLSSVQCCDVEAGLPCSSSVSSLDHLISPRRLVITGLFQMNGSGRLAHRGSTGQCPTDRMITAGGRTPGRTDGRTDRRTDGAQAARGGGIACAALIESARRAESDNDDDELGGRGIFRTDERARRPARRNKLRLATTNGRTAYNASWCGRVTVESRATDGGWQTGGKQQKR